MRPFLHAVATLAALAFAAPAPAQDVDCRSRNFQYQFCSTAGEVVGASLVRQESQAPCQQGRTWGWTGNGVWVSNGCSARFRVDTFRPAPPWSGGDRMSCDSRGFQYEFCPVPARVYSVQLLRQKSKVACVIGRTWGWREDGLWVSGGCQGDFRVQTAYRPTPPHGPGLTTCESRGFRYNFCGTGPIASAQLVERRSNAPCVRDQSWGYAPEGVWVDNGCSATFRIRGRW